MSTAFNAEAFCGRPPEECLNEQYRFVLYHQHQIPISLKQTLMREFSQFTKERPPDENKNRRICRGAVDRTYLQGALNVCESLAVGYHGEDPVAVVLTLGPSYISPLTNKPICLPHELHVDVVCAYFCYRVCGAETIRRFLAYARSRGVPALRLYATSASKPVWANKWGFQEAETIMRPDGTCVYGPLQKTGYPGETDSHRMTLILNASQEKPKHAAAAVARRRSLQPPRKKRRT